MPTGTQVADWIEQNTDQHLTDWQKQMVGNLFDHQTNVITMPRRTGRTSLIKSIEQAVAALERA